MNQTMQFGRLPAVLAVDSSWAAARGAAGEAWLPAVLAVDLRRLPDGRYALAELPDLDASVGLLPRHY